MIKYHDFSRLTKIQLSTHPDSEEYFSSDGSILNNFFIGIAMNYDFNHNHPI